MKLSPLKVLVFCAATAFASQASFAQQITDHSTSSSSIATIPADHTPHIRATQLIGVNVTSKEGENLGQVQDLVVDPSTGKIQYALVGKGFMAGLGEKVVPVPWQAVNVSSHKEFVLNVDPRKVQSAPAWTQIEADKPDYIIRVFRFYELTPTDVGTPGGAEPQTGQGSGSSDRSKDLLKDKPSSTAQPGSERDERPVEPSSSKNP